MKSSADLPLVVVCGASPTGLAVARDLGRRGISVCLADFDSNQPAFGSKYQSRSVPPIIEPDPSKLLNKLIEVARTWPTKPLLLPTSDPMVCLIAEHIKQLAPHYVVSDSLKSGVYQQFLDKECFSDLCLRNDIPVPKTAFPDSAEKFVEQAKDFLFPLILKPTVGHLWRRRLGGRKLLVQKSISQLQQTLKRFGDDLTGLMIQELIAGTESNLWVAGLYADRNSQVQQAFVGRKLRQYPYFFGSASLVESRQNGAVLDLSKKIIQAAGYTGLCGTEFKYDERDGLLKAIEVNPRPTLWFGMTSSADVPIHEYAVADQLGLPLPSLTQQKDGVRWLSVEKDFATAVKLMLSGRLGPLGYFRSLRQVTSHAVFAFDDPVPTWLNLHRYLRKAITAPFRHFSGPPHEFSL